jgi:hypothetical protein
VVGRVPRVAGVAGEALLADGPTAAVALDADAPGTGVPGELWITGPAGLEGRLGSAPFDALTLQSRRAVERGLRRDPAARGTLIALGAAGLASLLLALIALVTSLLADLRDERGELFDLEVQGLGPRRLRRHLLLRSAAIAWIGLAGGVALAAVLTPLVVRSVAATAGALAPDPPLFLSIDWLQLVATVAAAAVVLPALAGAVLAARFRREAVGRVAEAAG